MTMTEIAQERLEGQRIILENDKMVHFNSGADHGSSKRFGVLEILDTYEEKYLLAYSMTSGENMLSLFFICIQKIIFGV